METTCKDIATLIINADLSIEELSRLRNFIETEIHYKIIMEAGYAEKRKRFDTERDETLV